MNRSQFLGAILAPVALLFRRKKEPPKQIKNFKYVIGCDPIEPIPNYVVWEHDPGGPYAFKKIGEKTVEKGKLVWTKRYPITQ